MKYEGEINKKQVVGALFWKVLERLSVQGINLVVQIVLARLLLPEDFGSLAIIVAITNFASLFVQSGLATVITQRDEIDKKDISTFLTASLVIASVLYVLIFALAPVIANIYEASELKWALRAEAIVLFLNSINSIQTAVLSRKLQFRKIFVRSVVAVPLSGAVGIVMALLGFGVWALVAHSLSYALIVVIIMSLDKELRFSLGFSLERFSRHFAFSVKILFASLISSTHDTVRTMIIGNRYTKEDLAYYDKALTYSAYITQTVNASVQSVLLPTFSSKQNNKEQLLAMARNSVRISMFIMTPMLVGVLAVCRPLVLILLTEKWAESIPFLMLFCIFRIPGCMMAVDKQVYFAIGDSGVNFYYELVLFCVNLTTLFYTVQHGVMAIAIGATVVELLGGVAICIISAFRYGYKLRDRFFDVMPTVLCSLIMAGFVYLAGMTNFTGVAALTIRVAAGILSYTVASLLFNRKTVKTVLGGLKK